MIIFPAIDLKDGKAVRLVRGEMASAKIYSEHPEELAARFADLGAAWLHVVDLDGAFAGAARNFAVIERIIARSGLKVQVGGGIRSLATAADYVNAGAARVILGSIALTDPALVREAAARFAVAVGIDALGGRVATQGWADVSDIAATELAAQFAGSGVEAIITTDIAQDGTLGGVNVAFTQAVARSARGVAVIASGGVATLDDIRAVRACGDVAGVIVGKAFYEGTLDLAAAFALARGARG